MTRGESGLKDANGLTSAILPASQRVCGEQAALHLRALVSELDSLFLALQPARDARSCPAAIGRVQAELFAFELLLDETQLGLTKGVVRRTRVFAQRLLSGDIPWCHISQLAIEELCNVLALIGDLLEVVGTDSACKFEERVSFRILARVDPWVLNRVDGMGLRDIRFHQVGALKIGVPVEVPSGSTKAGLGRAG